MFSARIRKRIFIVALPKAIETPRLVELRAIVAATQEKALENWPLVTRSDYTLFGKYITLFSYIDLNLRRIVEAAAQAGVIKENKTPASDLNMDNVENAIRTLPGWANENKKAIGRIKELRKIRNILAHFGVKRFPKDDAFLFITKSAQDFREAFGEEPTPHQMMFVVAECASVRNALKKLTEVENWLSYVAAEPVRRFAVGHISAAP
jgi:hypothetical protein